MFNFFQIDHFRLGELHSDNRFSAFYFFNIDFTMVFTVRIFNIPYKFI